MKKSNRSWKGFAAASVAAVMAVTMIAAAGTGGKPVLAEDSVLGSAVSTVSFENTKTGIRDMHTKDTASTVTKDEERGSVLKLGKMKIDEKKQP